MAPTVPEKQEEFVSTPSRSPHGPEFYPRFHRFIVEIVLALVLLHAAYSFLKWLFTS